MLRIGKIGKRTCLLPVLCSALLFCGCGLAEPGQTDGSAARPRQVSAEDNTETEEEDIDTMLKEIYFAGGCFWGTEKVFKEVPGVKATTVGYANGHTDNPTYREVCSDTTGHRETVKVEYAPDEISLEKLLQVFFLVIDPTVENRQGNDRGTQYQTGVYYSAEEDAVLLEAAFEKKKKEIDPFYVELKPLEHFWTAEEYHQDYLEKNPGGYCHITPVEMEEVRALFAENEGSAG